MSPDEVGRYAESLPGVRRKGTASRPAWYVRDRLVVRLHDPDTLVVRVPLDRREALLERFPDSFGVPPRMEAHHKVEAYLDRAQPDAVRAAIDLAWEMQQR
ncbi:MmcQ/YjbR family DNA-binding protein [Nocardioides sediminis]|uniref:MmcQ/YjbR family DNA-binding protein n=1 Tax=Nocardioides sediminis TaxID=433648 RepID=UPI000D2F6317|nr:MmcQ/YjbR family DNA-binding protein [Nocardioides sediminis]